jgi:hypothetical protein
MKKKEEVRSFFAACFCDCNQIIVENCIGAYTRLFVLNEEKKKKKRPSTSIIIADFDDASNSISLAMIIVLIYIHI